jgi:hypothetical protein
MRCAKFRLVQLPPRDVIRCSKVRHHTTNAFLYSCQGSSSHRDGGLSRVVDYLNGHSPIANLLGPRSGRVFGGNRRRDTGVLPCTTALHQQVAAAWMAMVLPGTARPHPGGGASRRRASRYLFPFMAHLRPTRLLRVYLREDSLGPTKIVRELDL